MAFTPKIALTHIRETPTLEQLNGTFGASLTKQRAWAIRLKMGDDQRRALAFQAKRDGIADESPTAGKLDGLRNRISLVTQRGLRRVPHGWSTRLNRPNPTVSGGVIIPRQLHVTQERIAFPGTEKKLDARVTVLYETELGEDNKTLSNAEKIGKVVAYELGDKFILWRKMEAQPEGGESPPPDPAFDSNQGRTLIINAHGSKPSRQLKKVHPLIPLPNDMALSYGVPNGYKTGTSLYEWESEIGMLAEKRPCFASVRKLDESVEEARINPGNRLVAPLRSSGRVFGMPKQARTLRPCWHCSCAWPRRPMTCRHGSPAA
jgi:hypothetical protein